MGNDIIDALPGNENTAGADIFAAMDGTQERQSMSPAGKPVGGPVEQNGYECRFIRSHEKIAIFSVKQCPMQ